MKTIKVDRSWAWAREATAAKKHDKKVINAVLGVFNDNKNKLFVFKATRHACKNIHFDDVYNYPPVDGGSEYHQNVLNWTFRSQLENINKKFFPVVTATVGGTTALHATMKMFTTEQNPVVVIPHLSWANYIPIIERVGSRVCIYEYFNDYLEFNANGFKSTINRVLKTQKSIVVLLNTPAHNPTGYSLTENEFDEVISFLNQCGKQNKRITFVIDPAYMDYVMDNWEHSRDIFGALTKLHKNILPVICFSASKTFTIYGIRTGAQIILARSQQEAAGLKCEAANVARATWSTAPALGISIVNYIMSHKKLYNQHHNELEKARYLLINRAQIFIREAEMYHLKMYKYRGGFFITLPCSKPEELREELLKDKIHILPIAKAIRIAISSISIREAKGLAKTIVDAKKRIDCI